MNPDRALVDAVLADAPGAFERLVRAHQDLVWHLVRRIVPHPEDARDVSQETFLRVHRTLHQYRGDSSLRTWIGRVACSIALRHAQRASLPLAEMPDADAQAALLESLEAGVDLEAACAEADLDQRLHAAIETLPPLQRAILTLYHLDDVPLAEIATITGLATGTIKSHLFRTRARLRELLAAELGATP